jgi:hypothetical protein
MMLQPMRVLQPLQPMLQQMQPVVQPFLLLIQLQVALISPWPWPCCRCCCAALVWPAEQCLLISHPPSISLLKPRDFVAAEAAHQVP